MREWGYSLSQLEVQPGERIRLNIRNDGNIPHEFMFMPMANMQAIAYRLERADWNLLEHAAPYERSLVLPGQSFEVTMRIAEPGAWMFMCMFPYHMQFGMMGQMATPGLSMAM
ncbi:multicopper oxidase domain-containing protein [Aurantimonas sp. C2-6-R+9]